MQNQKIIIINEKKEKVHLIFNLEKRPNLKALTQKRNH